MYFFKTFDVDPIIQTYATPIEFKTNWFMISNISLWSLLFRPTVHLPAKGLNNEKELQYLEYLQSRGYQALSRIPIWSHLVSKLLILIYIGENRVKPTVFTE